MSTFPKICVAILLTAGLSCGCRSVPVPPDEIPWEKPPALEDAFCTPVTLVAPKENLWNKVPLSEGWGGYDFIKRPGPFHWDAKKTVDVVTTDGHWLISGRREPDPKEPNAATIWSLTDPEAKPVRLENPDGKRLMVSWIAATPNGSAFLAYHPGRPGTLAFYERASGRQILTLPVIDTPTAATFTPDGRCAVLASSQAFEIWDLVTGNPVAMFPTEKNPGLELIRFSPDGRFFAAMYPNEIRVFEPHGFVQLASFPASNPIGFDFSPDGRSLVIARNQESKNVLVYSVGTKQKPFEHREDFAIRARVELYETGTWRPIWNGTPDDGQRFSLRSLRFSRDGRSVIAAGQDIEPKDGQFVRKTALCRLDVFPGSPQSWVPLDYRSLPLHAEGRFLLEGRWNSLGILSDLDVVEPSTIDN